VVSGAIGETTGGRKRGTEGKNDSPEARKGARSDRKLYLKGAQPWPLAKKLTEGKGGVKVTMKRRGEGSGKKNEEGTSSDSTVLKKRGEGERRMVGQSVIQ